MAEIMGFSLFAVVAFLLAGIGCLLHVIGLSVVYWVVSEPFISGVGIGLWKTCILSQCVSYSTDTTPDYWKATQAFVIIGFLIGAGGCFLSLVSLLKKDRTIHLIASILCIVSAGCILLAIVIFGAETTLATNTQYGWGFILCIVSTFFFAPAGVFNFLAYRNAS